MSPSRHAITSLDKSRRNLIREKDGISSRGGHVSLAALFMIRRLGFGFIIFPSLVMLLPTIGAIGWSMVMFLISFKIFIALGVGSLFTNYVRLQIKVFAPNNELALDALNSKKTTLLLPVISVSLSFILISVFHMSFSQEKPVPLQSVCDSNYIPQAAQVGFYLALRVMWLNMIVVARFVGPFAVVDCSNGPLQTNPVDVIMKTLSSVEAILDKLTTPSLSNGRQCPDFLRPSSHSPRHFIRPTILRTVTQIFVHGLAGALWGAMLPVLTNNHDVITISVALGFIMNLTNTVLANGSSHQINTNRYLSIHKAVTETKSDFFSVKGLKPIIRFLLGEVKLSLGDKYMHVFVLYPLASLILSIAIQPKDNMLLMLLSNSQFFSVGDLSYAVSQTMLSLFISFLGLSFCAFYLSFMDAIFRLFLSQPINNTGSIFRIISTSKSGLFPSSKNFVVTQSIIHTIIQNVDVTRQILVSLHDSLQSSKQRQASSVDFSSRQQTITLETQQQAQLMARLHFHPSSVSTISLSQQMLRTNLLATLSLPNYTSNTSPDEIMYHCSCVIRTLCVYTGGLGQSLMFCCDPVVSKRDDLSIVFLPPGAIAQGSNVVRGIGRILSSNPFSSKQFQGQSGVPITYYSTHLQLLLPSILQNVHLLHEGIIAYASSMIKRNVGFASKGFSSSAVISLSTSTSGRNDPELKRNISARFPELKGILFDCEDVVLLIICKLFNDVGEEWKQWRMLSDDCKAWLSSLILSYEEKAIQLPSY